MREGYAEDTGCLWKSTHSVKADAWILKQPGFPSDKSQAHLGNTAGFVPDHHNKAGIVIK